ncbi:flavodoxin [Xylanimonas oleitrophica]|uniref:Flavodoxin n=1 Tax=Xylanimonas oleitrophica TaxID=2607479 RepID=A0A2W5XT58_9MICO|nr:flavodoxin domain-containing protein [Xylanimonas oleitrophica]PZR53208.1 flavodoxin [Xylanimonas oleitrophica]
MTRATTAPRATAPRATATTPVRAPGTSERSATSSPTLRPTQPANVLVAFGSTRGGTAGIAQVVAATLREEGFDVDLRDAGQVVSAEGYDAVVLGGAVYTGRWHRDARAFARRHASVLRHRPLWMFSSGPLDTTADDHDLPTVRQAGEIAAALRAVGHRTFGGRLSPNPPGVIAKAVARSHSGDFRNTAQIAAWAREIAAELRGRAEQAR